MGKNYEGDFIGTGFKFCIVISRFNDFVGKDLLRGAQDTLQRHGVSPDAIDVAWVPGAFEIPLVAKCIAESRRYQAIICLGVVIRGATTHFEHVAGQVASGIAATALDTSIPILFGVLTTETIDQAIERAGAKSGNKGADAAMAALEMVNLLQDIKADYC